MIASINPCNNCGRYIRPGESCSCPEGKMGGDLYDDAITNDSFGMITIEEQRNLNEKRTKTLVENSRVQKSIPVD